MSVECFSPLSADPGSIPVSGSSELSFDVQVTNDDLKSFDVEFRIDANADVVRFEGGGTALLVPVSFSKKMFKVRHKARFVCADPTQTPTAFISIAVSARVLVDGTEVSHPPQLPRLIPITQWNCGAAMPLAAKARKTIDGTTSKHELVRMRRRRKAH